MKTIILIIVLFAGLRAFSKIETATLAGGCFWCMEPPFEKKDGVISVVSGYAGGTKKNPKYKEVASGRTKHIETVEIKFDSNKITYEQILNIFWKNINPTDNGGQFVDRGQQYRPAIFYHNQEQLKIATESKINLQKLKPFINKKVTVEIIPLTTFYKAEEYHQDYYKKNPIRYKYYRYRSGRDQYLKTTWK